MKSFRNVLAATLMLGLATMLACGDDVEKEGDDDDSTTTTTTTTTGTEQCGPAMINQDDACEVCMGNKCAAETLACCEAPGCLEVVYCAAESGCNGVDCYTPDKCQAEIDAAGLEAAMNLAQPMGDCAIAQCPDECADMVPPTG